MKFSIERPRPQDLTRLIAFYRECRAASDLLLVPDYFRALPDDIFSAGWTQLFAQPDSSRAALAVVDGQWAGFYAVGPAGDADYAACLSDCPLPDRYGELHQLYLYPAFQRQGIGRALYAHARQDLAALGYPHFTICAYQENKRALAFYTAMGANFIKEDTLHLIFDNRLWHRPVAFMLDKTAQA